MNKTKKYTRLALITAMLCGSIQIFAMQTEYQQWKAQQEQREADLDAQKREFRARMEAEIERKETERKQAIADMMQQREEDEAARKKAMAEWNARRGY